MPTLYYSPTSPYARKARIAILESGLSALVEMLPTNPWDSDPQFVALNPLSKVPTLATEEGLVLYDSPVVCEYLDSLHEGPKLFPPGGLARWIALRQQALGDGIVDAAVLRRLDAARPAEQQSADWQARQRAAMDRGLDSLEADAAELGEGPPTVSSIACGCALGYLDFRFAGEPWREGRPQLAAWFERFSARASYLETAPPPQ
jgi:glutathione S-transferase